MSDPDLFYAEAAALEQARCALDADDASEASLRGALQELTGSFERLIRETRRLIRRSDRQEREMSLLNERLQQLARELEYRAAHDVLTGALNRRAVIETVGKLLQQGPLAVVVLDIDHFKRINDEFGHPAGDAVIAGVVQCLRAVIGDNERVGRVGGEEFTVLLPGHSLDEASEIAEKLRGEIAGRQFPAPMTRPVTASFGVSWNPQGSCFSTAYARADAALYQAKRSGRNRVCRAEPEAPPP